MPIIQMMNKEWTIPIYLGINYSINVLVLCKVMDVVFKISGHNGLIIITDIKKISYQSITCLFTVIVNR